MAGVQPREQALPLLAAANNHGDLAVKLSSLKQAKDILLSVEPSQAAELFPYLVELQSSPETLVRKYLLEVIDEIGARTREHLSILLPVLLTFLKDNNPVIAKQSIVTGTKFFCIVLEELAFQFQRRGIVERWLEELWTWMIKFRDAVLGIIFEVGSVGPKLLAIKFLERYVLYFTLDSNDFGTCSPEVMIRQGRVFNISWIMDGHPLLDPPALVADANRFLGVLLDMLRSASNFPGSLTIAVVNSIAAIARKRPIYYKSVLSALLDFAPSFEVAKARHTVSIQYSLRTAFLGFLRCTHPVIAESRDRLIRELRAMNAGDAADQVIRQMDKIMKNNERASRDLQVSKDDQLSNQLHVSGDVTKKRLAPVDNEDLNNSFDATSKRLRYGLHNNIPATVDFTDARQDNVNGISPKLPVSDGDLTPEEQMIAMIGALIAEGERGLESLEILISNIHPDLLADIVITNMKHLPNNPPPLTRYSNLSLNRPSDSSSDPSQVVASNGFPTIQALEVSAQVHASSSNTTSLPFLDMSTSTSPSTDSKRDPRRDPRRLDPRRMVVPVDAPPSSVVEDNANPVQYLAALSDNDASSLSNPPVLLPPPSISESTSGLVMPSTETNLNLLESPVISEGNQSIPKFEVQDVEDNEFTPDRETSNGVQRLSSPISKVEDSVVQASIDVAVLDEAYSPSSSEAEQLSPDRSNFEASEIASTEFPVLPLYIGLAEDHQRNARRLALERIINSYQNSHRTDLKQTQIALVARLFAQTDVNDVIGMVQQRIVSDYEQQKGHELVMYILYHLHSLVISDPASSVAVVYEKFLLGVAKSLLGDLPASDKSFSRLLGEVPCIPDSVLGLLGDICTRSQSGSDGRDGDRVTQGLGAVWSLILGRPGSRKACLDIALKCTIHPKDDVRAKAIRLVSNKLYAISYLSESIEQFATDMFLSAIDQRFSDSVVSQSAESEKRVGGQVESAETSISGSQVSDPEISQNDTKGVQNASLDDTSIPSLQAYSLMSLFFALCTKKPTLLQLVFDSYGRAQKAVKQAVHRHISVLMRAMGSSFSQLLSIISNPPHGSEDLLTQVLHALCEGITPPPDLVVTVKGLYETRLKDATILIPIISAFSKDEVLPIFPRLVQLPLNKFQMALAHILQGSAHTGPALTPAEVLVAIHDISPEKDGLPLKKITDACSACFEQRTVFTQQVLTKALNQMVDRTPLPLLYMRTVIQAIDAFPTLVDFVMEILSKLVNRQIWRMPKLWVGFLKCISQTQPHSFRVLLQLPPPQLESALNKYPNLRGPLTAFVNQSSVQTSLPRSTLVLLGLAPPEEHMQHPHVTSSLHASDPSSSVRGATFT
ncbi:symplekin isoform X1 [Sesamum indicum]|uniref:Symplekin isoform X1 n=2 Tax=Sesamum indicum TaxID=4182 RepID=A0A6I9SUT5_SESIN|nr:symplekin isoform X1 [Sesamum indicum]